MASVTFKRGTRAEIEATAKQDGQILMETDQTNNKMYVDLQNNNRVRIGNSNVDDISGITDSLTATSSNIALSAAGGNNLQRQIDTLNSNLKSKVKSYSYTPNASDLKSAIAVFCALRNSADTFSSFQGLIPNMKTKYIDISTGSVVLKDITWSKTNGTITGDISSYEVRFICIF